MSETIAPVIGIDPSSTATGVVALLARLELRHGGLVVPPEGLTVVARTTLRPKGTWLPIRLVDLRQLAEAVLRGFMALDAMRPEGPKVAAPQLVIEDPTDFPTRLNARGQAGNPAAKVGAAFGVLLTAIDRAMAAFSVDPAWSPGWSWRAIPSQEWTPRTVTRGRQHRMKHAQARALLRARWPALAPSTDDETFAAGVALFALEGCRLVAR